MSDEAELASNTSAFEPVRAGGPVTRQRRGPVGVPQSQSSLQAPATKVALPAPYEYLDLLGRGGMGLVYLAKDTVRERSVAIKFLHTSNQDASLSKRFQREASQLSELRHPNIVGFYEAGYFQKQNYIVMEYIEGGSLRGLLGRQEGPLTVQQSLELFAEVADGLEYIHNCGLVHRDLKPDNILLDLEGHPKIGDFGLAMKMEDQSRITQSGMILGTYSYLSPEQILSRDVGTSTDLYALGCCMYEAITGRPLFSADTEFALLNCHLRQNPTPPRQVRLDIPAELDTLILRLLQKQPADRPDTAAEVARSLRRMQQSLKPTWSLPVVGRQTVLEQMENLLRPCLLRQSVAVLITAPSGQGRSCLVRQLVSQLQRASIAVHSLVPLPHQLEPAEALFHQLGGTPQAWVEALKAGGPEAAARLIWKHLEQLGAPRLLVIDDLLRQPSTTNAVIEALCFRPPPPGFGWICSCAQQRAESLRLWDGASRIELAPLDDQALRDVAHLQVSGHLDDELCEGLLFRSAGSVRGLRLWLLALKGAGLLQRHGQMVQRDTGQPWPESLWEPLWLQISSRPEAEVKLLSIAALLDEPFPYHLIQQLSELEEAEAQKALDLLLRDGLMEECWGLPGELYQFSSKELKEKLQASSTDRLRRRVYARAAQILEGRAATAILALYLRRAGNEAEALPRFLQAAVEAEQRGDLLQAENNWSQALSVCSPQVGPEVRCLALVGRCEILLRLGRLPELEQAAEAELARPLAESSELRKSRRQLAGLVARARWLQQRNSELRAFCEREMDQLARSDFSDSLWLSWCWAACLRQEGEPEKALEILQRLPEQERYPEPYYGLLAGLLRQLGRLPEAQRVLQSGLENSLPRSAAEEVELFLEMALTQVQLGQPVDQQGKWLDQAVGKAHQLGDLELLAEIEWVRGLLHEAQHDMGAALRAFQRVIDTAPEGSAWRSQGALQLGVALSKMDRLEEASRTLQQGLESPQLLGQLYLGLGALEIQRGQWERAREAFASAERHAAGPAARLMRCWCLGMLGQPEVAKSLLDSLELLKDPKDLWLRQRLIDLQDGRAQSWPSPEEQPWVLAGHPLRNLLVRLVPLIKPPERPASQVVFEPASVEALPAPGPARLQTPLIVLGLLMALVLVGLGLRPLIQRRQAVPDPTPTTTASLALVTATPSPTPSAPAPVALGPGTLLISVSPPISGEVRLNGKKQKLLKGRWEQSLDPGSYHVEISAAGYRSEERDPVVVAEERSEIQLALKPLTGKLELRTEPSPCQVYLDGQWVGKSSGSGGKFVSGKIKVGVHTVKAVRTGYESKSKKVTIASDQVHRTELVLDPVYVPPPPPPPSEPVYQPPEEPYYAPEPAPYQPPAPAPAPAPPPSKPYVF